MYCKECGKQLPDGSKFCDSCGTKQGSAPVKPEPAAQKPAETPVAPSPQWVPPAPEAPVQAPVSAPAPLSTGYAETPPVATAPVPAQAVGDAGHARAQQKPAAPPVTPAHSDYYAAEFAKIAAGQKSKFNWAAFLLAPFHLLYRKCTSRFLKLLLPVLAVSSILAVVSAVSTVLFAKSFDLSALAVSGGVSILSGLVGIWGLVVCLINGLKFNQYYYHQVKGDAAAPVSKKGPAILAGAVAAFAAVVLIAISVATHQAITGGDYLSGGEDWMTGAGGADNSIVWQPDYDDDTWDETTDGDYASTHYTDTIGRIIQTGTFTKDTGAYFVGVADMNLNHMVAEGAGEGYLAANSSATFGSAVEAFFDHIEWQIMDSRARYLVLGSLDGTMMLHSRRTMTMVTTHIAPNATATFAPIRSTALITNPSLSSTARVLAFSG